MWEVEQKYRIDDPRQVEAALVQLGAHFGGEENHRDLYLNAPDRQYRTTDEVLRVRTVDGRTTLTYKGPKQPGEYKSRREIEVDLVREAHPEAGPAEERLIDLLRALRYRPVAEVRKVRHVWRLKLDTVQMSVCIDHLDGLGEFLELEVLAASDDDYDTARISIAQVEKLLGLNRREDRSYLRMVLEAQGNL